MLLSSPLGSLPVPARPRRGCHGVRAVIPLLPIEPGPFRLTLGVRALGAAPIALVDEARHRGQVRLRERLLAEDHGYRYRGGAATEPAQWEAVALLLRDLARHHPRLASLSEDGRRWTWESRVLGARTAFRLGDRGSLPREPLDWVGRQVVEDLVLLSGDSAAGFPVVAGQVCFPNDWSLPDKLGRPVLGVHEPVPGFARQVGEPTLRLLERLRPGRPVWRANWAIRATDALDLSPRAGPFPAEGVDAGNAGEALFVRVERQTLSRLPGTGAILFTIHTRSRPLGVVAGDRERAGRLLEAARTMPPEMARYKGIAPVRDALIAYLVAPAR
jgi:dimethylamine monooxygenase subunit A